MSIFNKNNDSHNIPLQSESSLFSPLATAKDNMLSRRVPDSGKLFAQTFADVVNSGEWVAMPVRKDENGYASEIYEHQANHYVVIYTDQKHSTQSPKSEILVTDINKAIDVVYSNPHINGLALDPYTAPVFITRKQINGLTKRKDPRQSKRNWGEGIPKYQQEDLMVEEELLDFGMQIVKQYALESDGYEIIEYHNGLGFAPNFVAEKGGRTYYILVEVEIAPKMPSLDEYKRVQLVEYAKKHGACCLYAPVGIGSADAERFDASLALCGDGFYANFRGFEELI